MSTFSTVKGSFTRGVEPATPVTTSSCKRRAEEVSVKLTLVVCPGLTVMVCEADPYPISSTRSS
jgi:hypothetical protein